jgi:hypothetical protein
MWTFQWWKSIWWHNIILFSSWWWALRIDLNDKVFTDFDLIIYICGRKWSKDCCPTVDGLPFIFFPISIVSSYHLFSHLYSYPMDNKCITLMIHSVHIKGKLYRFILFPWKNSRHHINSITADIERLVYIFHLFFILYNILLISQYFTPRAYM